MLAPRFKNTARALFAAALIGGTAMAAIPAQAAGASSFSFSFNTGNGLGFNIPNGNGYSQNDRGWRHDRRVFCLSHSEIRSGLRDYGFHDIRFGREWGRKIDVEASRGRWDYTLKVDKCDGQVSQIRRQARYRVMPHEHSSSVSLNFNIW